MYQGTFERTDLGGVITNDELAKLETRLIQAGEPTPVPANIQRAVGTFNDHTAKYLVEQDRANRLIGTIAVYFLYFRLGAMQPIRQTAYNDAMTELRAIRDGKFPDMPLDGNTTPAESAPAPGRYGGRRRFHTR